MKQHAWQFRLHTILASALFILFFGFSLVYYRRPELAVEQMLLVAAVASGVFLLLMAVATRSKVRLYAIDLASLTSRDQDYHQALDRVGSASLQTMVRFLLCELVVLGAVYIPGFQLGLQEAVLIPVSLMGLSLAMLLSALIFIRGDRTTTEYLLFQKLATYPVDLRDNRQQRKTFIIPLFMSIMSLLLAYSMSALLWVRTGGELSRLEPASLGAMGFIGLSYLALNLWLVLTWNKTTALLYQSLISQMEQLTGSEKDLTRRVHIASVDEMGSIAGMINTFCQGLDRNLQSLKAAQGELSTSGQGLQLTAQTSSTAVQQILVAIQQAQDNVVHQQTRVESATQAMGDITDQIQALDSNISDQSASLTEASASIEEMVGTIGSIQGSIQRLTTQFSQVESESTRGSQVLSEVTRQIQAIAGRSKTLGEANQVIATIAAQTNLLAMNAAIEAAHAGDAGRGFSVVADEIRRLAETSAVESKSIKQEINQVQQAISTVVQASAESQKSLGNLGSQIAQTTTLMGEIMAAVEEQGIGAGQILEALKMLNELSIQVQEGSGQMRQRSSVVAEVMVQLSRGSKELSLTMEETVRGSEAIHQGSDRVSRLSQDTGQVITSMENELSRFVTTSA